MTPYDKWLLYWRELSSYNEEQKSGHRSKPSRSSYKLAHIREWISTEPTKHRADVERFLESCRG